MGPVRTSQPVQDALHPQQALAVVQTDRGQKRKPDGPRLDLAACPGRAAGSTGPRQRRGEALQHKRSNHVPSHGLRPGAHVSQSARAKDGENCARF